MDRLDEHDLPLFTKITAKDIISSSLRLSMKILDHYVSNYWSGLVSMASSCYFCVVDPDLLFIVSVRMEEI